MGAMGIVLAIVGAIVIILIVLGVVASKKRDAAVAAFGVLIEAHEKLAREATSPVEPLIDGMFELPKKDLIVELCKAENGLRHAYLDGLELIRRLTGASAGRGVHVGLDLGPLARLLNAQSATTGALCQVLVVYRARLIDDPHSIGEPERWEELAKRRFDKLSEERGPRYFGLVEREMATYLNCAEVVAYTMESFLRMGTLGLELDKDQLAALNDYVNALVIARKNTIMSYTLIGSLHGIARPPGSVEVGTSV
jgi:hypothetical protein